MNISWYFCEPVRINWPTIQTSDMPKIIKTEDGSDTLFDPHYGEHYHSIHGSIQESNHVFIDSGLTEISAKTVTIFEVGFGTGLNTFLTALETTNTNQIIQYITIEKHPLIKADWENLNYPEIAIHPDPKLFQNLHLAEWGIEIQINDNLSLYKINGDLTQLKIDNLPPFDLIYFDAFSPNSQPELWQTEIFQQLYNHCNPGAKIVTYCAKGSVRRAIIAAGFIAERLPGPPGKREMLRGTKPFK